MTASDARTGAIVESFSVSDDAWRDMRNAASGTFLLRHDDGPAVLHEDTSRVRWFTLAPAPQAPNGKMESVEHLFVKQRLALALRAVGIDARVEESGPSPSGEQCEADVYFDAGGRRVAIGVQLAAHTKHAGPDRTGTRRTGRAGMDARAHAGD